MIISEALLESAALIVARRIYGQDQADDQDRETARLILLDVAPGIAAAERERILGHGIPVTDLLSRPLPAVTAEGAS